MSTLVKSLLALAVALPLGAYVTGTLVASGEEPPPRNPVIINENTHAPTGRTEPTDTPDSDDDDDPGDDDEIDVITPQPGDVDDDNSGPGGGDDDHDDRGGDDDDDWDGGGDD